MGENMPKLVAEFDFGDGPELASVAASSNLNSVAVAIKTNPGVGNPFLYFATLSGQPALCNFALHPDWAGHGNVATSDTAANKAMLEAMLANPPTDALTM